MSRFWFKIKNTFTINFKITQVLTARNMVTLLFHFTIKVYKISIDNLLSGFEARASTVELSGALRLRENHPWSAARTHP